MAKKTSSYNNLIDVCIRFEEDPELSGNVKEQFGRVITDYFFEDEKNSAKSIELLLNNIPPPSFLDSAESIFNIKEEDLKSYIEGSSFNDSLAGKIMLSQQYLKAYYPHHTPSFNKVPEDVRFELMDLIKEKNQTIVAAFQKMLTDRQADTRRKIMTLIALILKNIHLKTGAPLNELQSPAEETIRSIFHNTDEVFTANQKQIVDLKDDAKIKQLIKTFFKVKQFKDLTGIANLFRDELERYRKRTKHATG